MTELAFRWGHRTWQPIPRTTRGASRRSPTPEATLDPTIAGMLTALDGTRTLGEVAGDMARLQTETVASVEDALLPIASEMLAAGFLVRS